MQVSGNHVFVHHALVAGFARVSQSEKDLAERGVVADVGAPAMVFEADDGDVKKRAVQDDVADEPFWLPFGGDVEDAESLDGSFVGLVIVAEQLVASAHRQHHAAVLDIGLEVVPDFLQIVTDQFLFPVGTAAKEHDVQLGKVNLVPGKEGQHLGPDSPPFQPLAKALDVSAVAV